MHNDKSSNFKQLLEKGYYVPTNHRNIQALAIEMHKVTNGLLSTEIINAIFQLREESPYNLRYTSQFTIPPIRCFIYWP